MHLGKKVCVQPKWNVSLFSICEETFNNCTDTRELLYPLTTKNKSTVSHKLGPHNEMLFLHYYFTFSVFLGKIKEAFDRNPDLQNLLLDDFFKKEMHNCQVMRRCYCRNDSFNPPSRFTEKCIDNNCEFLLLIL